MLHSVGGRATVVGTSLRAIASLFASATFGARVREVGVCNTTSTAVTVALAEFGSATNVGAGLTEVNEDINPTQCTAFAGHTADGASVGQAFRQLTLPAAVGATIVWTFSEGGFLIPIGTANGLGIIVPTGTGQICDFWFKWEE
jgi:hypothetical protein